MKRLMTAALIGLFTLTSAYALAAEQGGQEKAPTQKHAKKHHRKAHTAKKEMMKEKEGATPATPAAPATPEKKS